MKIMDKINIVIPCYNEKENMLHFEYMVDLKDKETTNPPIKLNKKRQGIKKIVGELFTSFNPNLFYNWAPYRMLIGLLLI